MKEYILFGDSSLESKLPEQGAKVTGHFKSHEYRKVESKVSEIMSSGICLPVVITSSKLRADIMFFLGSSGGYYYKLII